MSEQYITKTMAKYCKHEGCEAISMQRFNNDTCDNCWGKIQAKLEYFRGEIEAERISYGEIAELQGLAEHIEAGDVLLLEWAGVPEHEAEEMPLFEGTREALDKLTIR